MYLKKIIELIIVQLGLEIWQKSQRWHSSKRDLGNTELEPAVMKASFLPHQLCSVSCGIMLRNNPYVMISYEVCLGNSLIIKFQSM